jgi:hypothetical protein
MINNSKDIEEILNVIDNITKEQLDEAIKKADKFFENDEQKNEEE